MIGLMAIGMTFIIISGGIDLSVGSLMALSGMVGAGFMVWFSPTDSGMWWYMGLGTLAGITVGGIGGFLNGMLITRIKLQPFIVTLGTMSLFRGIALVMNDGQPYNVPTYRFLGDGTVLGIPISVIILAGFIVLALFLLGFTRFGRYVYAIGSNEQAAYHAGIRLRRIKVTVYTLAGFLVGLAGMITASRTISGQPTAGVGWELDVIAAVVIGGASLSGGKGSIGGTIIGTFLIQFLRNGCTLIGISTNAQLIVIGVIIILAVSLDHLAKKRSEKTSIPNSNASG